eukprot:2043744-Amphidinium_carterae.1
MVDAGRFHQDTTTCAAAETDALTTTEVVQTNATDARSCDSSQPAVSCLPSADVQDTSPCAPSWETHNETTIPS